jgi:hypothetical protein
MSVTTNPFLPVDAEHRYKEYSRQNWSRLLPFQRDLLRGEYRHLRQITGLTPFMAAGVIRRMAYVAAWR